MNDSIIKPTLIRMLQQEESCKLTAYLDPMGNITIAWGHNLSAKPIKQALADQWLIEDYDEAVATLRRALPWVDGLDPVRRAVLIDMNFNLGIGGLLTFKRMVVAAQQRKFKLAAAEMVASAWFKQVGDRGKRLVAMMATGQWPRGVAA